MTHNATIGYQRCFERSSHPAPRDEVRHVQPRSFCRCKARTPVAAVASFKIFCWAAEIHYETRRGMSCCSGAVEKLGFSAQVIVGLPSR